MCGIHLSRKQSIETETGALSIALVMGKNVSKIFG